jgi:RNA polymerase sigma-70 factor (sigma-E family)
MNTLSTGRQQARAGDRDRPPAGRTVAEAAVTALYAEHALGLTRLAQVMLGDRGAAEDAVQEAFAGLFRRWAHLADPERAPQYLRSAVLNQCRNALRSAARRNERSRLIADARLAASYVPQLATDERGAMLGALRLLPPRQREVLVLRYFLDLPDAEIAQSMGIRPGTVRSAALRGLAALERIMREETT